MTLDMTNGAAGRRIPCFALPLMFSMLQQLYIFCDSLIAGRFLGSLAVTATGAAGENIVEKTGSCGIMSGTG